MSRMCRYAGCRGVVVGDGDLCNLCGKQQRITGWQDDKRRGGRIARGYDKQWFKLRQAVIQAKRIECGGIVVCEFCGEPILVASDIHADHRIPFTSLEDPNRLSAENIRLAHSRCHMSHTASAPHRGWVSI